MGRHLGKDDLMVVFPPRPSTSRASFLGRSLPASCRWGVPRPIEFPYSRQALVGPSGRGSGGSRDDLSGGTPERDLSDLVSWCVKERPGSVS